MSGGHVALNTARRESKIGLQANTGAASHFSIFQMSVTDTVRFSCCFLARFDPIRFPPNIIVLANLATQLYLSGSQRWERCVTLEYADGMCVDITPIIEDERVGIPYGALSAQSVPSSSAFTDTKHFTAMRASTTRINGGQPCGRYEPGLE